ncbi:MAG: glycoside hydrolase family 36 protein [Armatimonadota bacterium]
MLSDYKQSSVLRDWVLNWPPFSFDWGGVGAADFLAADCSITSESRDGRSCHRLEYALPSGLVCIVELEEFDGFPAVEWVLRFRNDGSEDSPILQNVQALDITLPVTGKPCLYRAPGADLHDYDFQFQREPMYAINWHGWFTRMTAGREGRASVDWLPFFNIDAGNGGGLIMALGWSGQWAAEMARPAPDKATVRAGLELIHTKLHPGEEIRMPRVLLLPWLGEVIDGQNLLRRFLLKYHVPHYDGRPLLAPISNATWGGTPSPEHFEMVELIKEHQLPYDYYWVDAGWYGTSDKPCPDVFQGDWYKEVGNWQVNPHHHPGGLKPLSDAVHEAGMKFLLWVETERSLHGKPTTLEYPEWFLAASDAERKEGDNLLLDLGNPEACAWATELISDLIRDNGIDCYRQDFNMNPLECWRHHDAPDRQGMTEIRHIEGLYAFWDELRRRYPGLLIDNCASGGRRIELEMISRSIPLWRDDYNCFPELDPEVVQSQGFGLTCWVPLHATSPFNRDPGDTYRFRSALAAGSVFTLGEIGYAKVNDADYPWDWHRKMMEDYLRARPCWYGDYYPLTTCTLDKDAWLAFQLHRTDQDAGLILAFRRAASPVVSVEYPLRGLRPDASYTFEDADSGETWTLPGKQLQEQGLPLMITEKRASRLLFYTVESE